MWYQLRSCGINWVAQMVDELVLRVEDWLIIYYFGSNGWKYRSHCDCQKSTCRSCLPAVKQEVFHWHLRDLRWSSKTQKWKLPSFKFWGWKPTFHDFCHVLFVKIVSKSRLTQVRVFNHTVNEKNVEKKMWPSYFYLSQYIIWLYCPWFLHRHI